MFFSSDRSKFIDTVVAHAAQPQRERPYVSAQLAPGLALEAGIRIELTFRPGALPEGAVCRAGHVFANVDGAVTSGAPRDGTGS
jgi:hypothetical protein